MGKSRRILFGFVAVAVGMFFASAASLANDKQPWREKRSYHFFYYYYPDCSQSFLSRLKDASEDYYRTITQQLHLFRHDPWVWDRRAKIYVYRNKKEYLEKTKQPAWSAGCAVPAKKEIYTYAGSFGIFKGILAHEMTHLIVHDYVGLNHNIPLWLDEGTAMYIQYKTMGNLSNVVNYALKPLLHGRQKIPLAQLLSTSSQDLDKQQPLPQGNENSYTYVDKFYLEALSVVYFLRRKYGSFAFTNLFRDLRQGKSFNYAFSHHYYAVKDIKRFTQAWEDFYRR